MRQARNTSGISASAWRTSPSMRPAITSVSGVSCTTNAGSWPSSSSTVGTVRADARNRSMCALWRIRNSQALGLVPGRYV